MSITPYSFGCSGDSRFIRAAVESLDGTLKEYLSNADHWKEDTDLTRRTPVLFVKSEFRAFGYMEAAGAFMLFVATCFGKKIFDEFYDRLLKRPLAPYIDKLCQSKDLPSGRPIEVRDIVYLQDIDLVVVIRALVTADKSQEVAALVLQAHRVAHAYIERNGRKAPVHCHVIEDGKVSLEPELHLSLEHQFQADRAKR